ncbi:MAG TPA: alpha-amylase family glycosyl hydrolase [Pyrinomonadaceae bacterium]|nr:alpha-amylase family glycosyl hydrolase [Pyrinomonadaceae bacterium]
MNTKTFHVALLRVAALIGVIVCASADVHARAEAAAAPAAAPPVVQKVEPPSWWAGHTINPVRLLVRGANLQGARLTATRPETSAGALLINGAGTYLFVNLTIDPAARPGDYPLTLETEGGRTTIPFRLNAALDPSGNFQGVTGDDVIYLIMPDRFSNGDSSNDTPAGAPAGATDRANPRAYHGGDFRGLINHLSYLKELGVTALWLTPWYDNWNGLNRCGKPWCPNTYYHGYHAEDYYGVEDRFGDMGTLRELVERAHALGLKVIQDQVANHVGSRHAWVSDPPLDDWFNGTITRHELNRFNNSALLSPNANQAERRNTLNGWFSDELPDMNQDEPEVARYLIQNSLWWAGMTGIDGIRQDTIQYMPRAFIRELSRALHRQYPRMWMVGEVFERDAAQTAFFIGGHTGWDSIDTELDSVFDFALWQASCDVFTSKKPVRHLRDQLKYDALYPDASRVTTLLGNHDTRRFISLEGGTLEGAMLHMAFTLTVRGTPQLYYGDELAMQGGDDPDNRRDFPGGFPGDKRNAFEGVERTSDERRMYDWTRYWLRLRREHTAIRHGRLIDLAYTDDAYVFARQDAAETIIVAINRSETPASLRFPASALGSAVGSAASLRLPPKGLVLEGESVSLTVPARTALAYEVPYRPYPGRN